MSQEARRPSLEIAIFQDPSQRLIDIYTGEPDLDERAKILNEHVVQLDHEGVASIDSVLALRRLSDLSGQELTQYRPDAITSLNSFNLVGVANGLTAEEDNPNASLFETLDKIQQLGKAATKTEDEKQETQATFADHVFDEWTERINERDGSQERLDLMIAINELMSPALFAEIADNRPETFAAMLRCQEEFSNPYLREALTYTASTLKDPAPLPSHMEYERVR